MGLNLEITPKPITSGLSWGLTRDQLLSLDCNTWLLSSLLYYEWDTSLLTDEAFDLLSHNLLSAYPRLPHWFTCRVSRDDLGTGSGFALSFSNDERWDAGSWLERERALGRGPGNILVQ